MEATEWAEVQQWRGFALDYGPAPVASAGESRRPFGNSLAGFVAARLDGFARDGLFALCWACKSAVPRRMTAHDYAETQRVVLPVCSACVGPYKVPTLQAWPGLLWKVPAVLEKALRLISIPDACMTIPHPQGFRRHGRPCVLFWERLTVEERIQALPADLWPFGRAIYHMLVTTNGCYVAGLKKHREELQKSRGGAPLGTWAILERGIEAWLCPLLYHSSHLCESIQAQGGHHLSAKRAFVYKCYSGVLDYQRHLVLVAFQYDRALIARFVGRARAAPSVQLRWALLDMPQLPLHMELHRLQILDMCRQLGAPSFFITFAPGAYVTPAASVVEELRRQSGARCAQGGVLESLALLHLVREIVRGYLVGTTAELKGPTACTPFGQAAACLRCWVAKIEFQNDARGKGRQAQYHGTALPHVHLLLWHGAPQATAAATFLRQDFGGPLEFDLRAAVLRQQLSRSGPGDGCTTLQSTHWSWQGGRWQLQVKTDADAQERGVRAYLEPLARACLGHHDVQPVKSAGDVPRYLAKLGAYVSKSAEALSADAFDQGHVAMHAVQALLREHAPGEAEMMQQLDFGGVVLYGCHTKRFKVCRPDEVHRDEAWQQYCKRAEDEAEWSFLTWARAYKMRAGAAPQRYGRRKMGMTALGVMFASRTRDEYFGQWLVANIPCRSAEALWHADAARGPPQHKWFTAAWRLRPDVWDSAEGIQQHLESDGAHQGTYMEQLQHIYLSWKQLILHWLVCPAEVPEKIALQEARETLDADQAAAYACIMASVRNNGANPGRPFVLRGPAGTGKSFVIAAVVQTCLAEGLRVHSCTPTGALTHQYRPYLQPGACTVDTLDATFRTFLPDHPILLSMDVLIVDEIYFVDCHMFERILAAWDRAGRGFALLVAGDPGQLEPASGQPRCTEHGRWREMHPLRLRRSHRAADPRFASWLEQLRWRPASAQECADCATHVVPTTDLRQFFLANSGAVGLCVRKVDVADWNDVTVQQIFADETALGTATCVDPRGRTRKQLWPGLRIMVTHNVCKESGLTNGSFATVVALRPGTLLARLLERNVLVAVPRVRLPLQDGGFAVGFPIVYGYWVTIAKMQGRTLPTILVDPTFGVRGAAYVALSRVRLRRHIYWTKLPTPRFFMPF